MCCIIEPCSVNFKAIESKHQNIKNLLHFKEDFFKKASEKSIRKR